MLANQFSSVYPRLGLFCQGEPMSVVVPEFERRAAQLEGNRVARYREQAERFQLLADMEMQPAARARLLDLAGEYQQLAEAKTAKPGPR